ncbi:Gfo/Idh/MocA family oxidoreductase [Kluyvera genomosp. 1]|uniref:Gfo/Idh/MocA family oxidoreductase n=1 Tax=Kluyvera genomosp. 1 TaxID=2774053 RepID=UPI00068F3BCE|nr:Gfo/Idh/MocA family oxidoreductase [Kluyvera genomosp. 1]
MNIGFVGLGAVVETAWLPALQRLSLPGYSLWGYDLNAQRTLPGVTCCESLEGLLAKPIDTLCITTASLQHLPILEAALATPIPQIVVEKPIVATLSQISRLRSLLSMSENAPRVLALDHWMARDGALCVAQGKMDKRWLADGQAVLAEPPVTTLDDIVGIDGFLLEPSGFNAAGEPIALNFATGEPDTRQFTHPDGVIVDVGTHVLAMMREALRYLGGSDDLHLNVLTAKDRLGRPITHGDWTTAEGEAHLQGTLSGLPVNLWLNKYAGPGVERKGIRITLRDGRVISQNRCPGGERVELITGDRVMNWTREGAVYAHCLGEHIFGANSLFARAPQEVARLTQRRIAEVEALLQLQQGLRGVH